MSQPLVSVIVPAYNGAHTIRETLESALAQTYENVEIIVVDDASKDDTAEVVHSYGDKVIFKQREQNSGVCDRTRCDAINIANGKYCAFLDQDDLWTPDKLAKQVAFMEEHPDIPLSHTYVNVMDENGVVQEIRHHNNIPPTGPCARDLLEHCFITISSIMVRPQVWLDALNEHGMRFSNTDIESFFLILKKYPAGFGFIPEPLGSYRRGSSGMSRQNWKWSPEDINALERVYDGRYWEGLMPEGEVKELLSHAFLTNARFHMQQGRPGRSLFFIRRGIGRNPFHGPFYQAGLSALARGLFRDGFKTGS